MKRHLQLAVGIVVSVVCLWLAISGLELAAVGQALAGARYGWVLPALVLYFAGVWVRAVRWHHLLRPIVRLPSSRLFPVVVIGYMANDILPARLGELVRCYVLRRRDGVSSSAALGTVLLERVMDGLTMLALMAAALPLLPSSPSLYRLMAGAAILFGGAAVVLFLLATRPAMTVRLVAWLTQALPTRTGARLRALATSFTGGLASLGGLKATWRIFLLSCAAWLLEAGMYFALMFAFPLTPSLPLAILTTAVANLGTLIPSSPGYIGVFDFLGRSVLSGFGVPEATALAYVLVVHATLVVPVTLLGFWYAWREGGLRLILPTQPAHEIVPVTDPAGTRPAPTGVATPGHDDPRTPSDPVGTAPSDRGDRA